MQTKLLVAIVGASLCLIGAVSLSAHHAFSAEFDASKPVSISGTITEFEARNPHSYLHISAVDENGQSCERRRAE